MMNLTPYRRENSVFNLMDSLERSFFNDSIGGFAQFRTDISEKDGQYLLAAELPGFQPGDINVNVDGDTLTISAESSNQNDEKDDQGNFIRRERRYGSFSRSFDISGIDPDGISADYNNGVLNITLPKAQETKPETRRIAVNQKNSQPGMEQGGQNTQAQAQNDQNASQAKPVQPTNKPDVSIADQQAQYSAPAAEQAEKVQENSQPEEYQGGSKSDQPGGNVPQ